MSTSFRYLRILNLLAAKSSSGGLTTDDILGYLKDDGYVVSIRTVQRDMKALEEAFQGIVICENEDGASAKWRNTRRYKSLESMTIPLADALTLELVRNSLSTLFPYELWQELEPRFASARNSIREQADSNCYAAWGHKVRSVLPTLPMELPTIASEILRSVQTCLLNDQQLEVEYLGWRPGEVKTLILHPQALIQRGTVTYLIALTFDYDDVLMYSLHRIRSARCLYKEARQATGFDIDAYIAAGNMQYGDEVMTGQLVHLQLRVAHWLQRILVETPLSKDQMLCVDPADADLEDVYARHYVVSATVRNTRQLQWWLLGNGEDVQVLQPMALRERIHAVHRAAAQAYAVADVPL